MENSTEILDERDEHLALWEIGVLTVILIVTVIGNGLILVALYLRRYYDHERTLTRMYFFVLHLSIADLMTGIFNLTPQLAWDITFRFQGGAILCKAIKFMQPFGNYLSSYILTATAIDRYYAICSPLNYYRTTSTRSRTMVCAAWCLSFVLCIPQVLIFSYREIDTNIWDCWALFDIPYGERIYVTWFSVTVFFWPLIILLYTYIRIYLMILRNSKITPVGLKTTKTMDSSSRNRSLIISRARINTVKQMIIIISLYAVTHSPFIGCELWATWDPNAAKSIFFNGPIFTILTLLSSLTNCVNPWIYLAYNRELRIVLVKYMKKIILRKQIVIDYPQDNVII